MRKVLSRFRTERDAASEEGPGRAESNGRRNPVPPSLAAAAAAGRSARRTPPADLSGRIIGTWRILHETELDRKRHCMCQCVRCGVRRSIAAFKLLKGYALRCRECRIGRELAG